MNKISKLEEIKQRVMEKPASHQPKYPDNEAVARVSERLTQYPAAADYNQIVALKKQLADVANGKAFLLQAGPCVQNAFDDDSQLHRMNETLRHCAETIADITGQNVVTVGRHFNYAKPRSNETEIVNKIEMPTYKGSSINSSAANIADRTPAPHRMESMHIKTCEVVHRNPELGFHSHESLLLPYEFGLLRETPDGTVYSGGAHSLWIGHRTKQPDGAHMELAGNIANPVGIKIGSNTSPEELGTILNKLDPKFEDGKVTLIFRMGARNIYGTLGPLLDVVKQSGHNPILMSDPMHGNGKTIKGIKTRFTQDIITEMNAFSKIVTGKGMHVGGVMLEAVGENVTECVGHGITVHGLKKNYQSKCDPCLNPTQAMAVLKETSEVLVRSRKAGRKDDVRVHNLAWAM